MSKVSLGKLLLRNVIRHTDAHNKIQEESEMWKLRGLEQQASTTHSPVHRGRMHCDRYFDNSEGSMQEQTNEMSERDERESRYWTRKLYEFEANDPDRWGHSGFKELYPEEFHTDREKESSESKHRRKKHKNKLNTDLLKSVKKSSKKKKKKKEKKKKKKLSEEEDTVRRKRRKRKRDHRDKDGDSRSGTRTHRKNDSREKDSEPQRKKRKNWKVANEERSEESSDAL